MAAAQQATQFVVDEHVAGLADSFAAFLADFSPEGWMPEPSQATQGSQDAGAAPRSFMARRVEEMCQSGETVLYVEYDHLQAFSYEMSHQIRDYFERAEPVMRRALQDHVRAHQPDYLKEAHGVEKEFFVGVTGLPDAERLRDLRVEKIGRLVSFSGTVTRTTEVRPELFLGAFKCAKCSTRVTGVEQQYKYTTPTLCKKQSCGNRTQWILDRDESVFVDWQRVKVQENVDEIPGGALPRTMDVILRANNVDRAKAGDRVSFCGTLVVCPDVSALVSPGQGISIRPAAVNNDAAGEGVVGVGAGNREVSYRLMFIACSAQSAGTRDGMVNIRSENEEQTPDEVLNEFSERDREEVLSMKDQPTIYADLARSICPSVYGHEPIKQAVLLMLFGGVHKRTMEGTNLRGDINLAIIGDPSCAKSQLLKYVAAFLPRAVYTSGKASTAAGLTASVVKEPENNEFAIEAGALMLADNGICCIDEFDKMDVKDQVAIHEAMEQQTISIAKAGIQATLNARASIFAAANPLNGRYDKSKPLKQNIQLPPAILSRFDLLHVMIDETTELMDERIAQHIVDLHRDPTAVTHAVPFSTEAIQRYIKYARAIKPVLTEQAQAALVRSYKRLRSEDAVPGSQSAYRITVRQLEALVRLSEAMARVYCSEAVDVQHVAEATKLLQASILKIEQGDLELDGLVGAPIDEVTGEELPDAHCEELLQGAHLPRGKAAERQADGDAAAAARDQAGDGDQAAAAGGDAAADAGAGAGAPSKAGGVKISAKKLEFIKAMLLNKLRDETAHQEALAAERAAAPGGGGGGGAAMDVDGEQQQQREGGDQGGAGGEQPGMKQQDLVDWYMEMQINRKAVTTYEEGEAEYDLAFKVISHLIKREGLLVVVSAPRRAAGEAADAYRNRVWKERRLALSPSYVPE